MGNKDDIIASQLEIIRRMTESNLRNVAQDFFGEGTPAPQNKDTANSAPAEKKAEENIKKVDTEEKEQPKEDIEELKKELFSYIGLEEVKKEVNSLINIATVYALRKKNGLASPDMSLHLVFSGNPGTGKTMIARFMARVYHSLGLLSKGQLIEVDRSGLVAGYVGQTAQKTAKVLESALGGVLFIDEAYALTSKGGNDYGMEAVETVLKYMEDHRDDLIVIIAGYTDLMQDFIASNPGLASRFNKYIEFADYTPDEMVDIFKMNCKKGQYEIEDSALSALKEYFTKAVDIEDFGNARGVRNTFENVICAQANRLAEDKDITKEELILFTEADIIAACK
ncbi:MAG: AAA family ATPase [Clostridia bacterium]|nr:AAA family ATPase [Clostridia bacterium]